MERLDSGTAVAFTAWLRDATRPHVATLAGRTLTIDNEWAVDLRVAGRLLQGAWQSSGAGRLLWTREGVVSELIRQSGEEGWEWVRSATTAWRVLHSSKGATLPVDIKCGLAEVVQDAGAARFALDMTRLEAVLAASTARGLRVDTATLESTHEEMLHTKQLLTELLGFDPLREENEAATREWLKRNGITVEGVSSEHWGTRLVGTDPLAREAELVFEKVLFLRRRLPKVRELRAATRWGVVRTTLTPAAQVSGRISSTTPALNNVSADLRHLLIARPAHVFVTADFDGIEPRVLAALSGDARLIRDLEAGDPYADAAERAGYDRVAYRRRFKVIMISSMYGAQPGRTARQLGVSLAEAKRIRALLWAPYSVAASWLRAQYGFAAHRLDSGRPLGVVDRGHARPNLIIQSTAYDIFQAATLRVHAQLPPRCHIALPMHDELIVEAPEGQAVGVESVLRTHMPTEFRGVTISAKPVTLGRRWRKV